MTLCGISMKGASLLALELEAFLELVYWIGFGAVLVSGLEDKVSPHKT